jgi:hypothetical protein
MSQMSLRQYIEYVEEMIATPGWSILVEEAKKEIYQLQADALESADWGAVQRKRGAAERLAELTHLDEVIANQRTQMEEERDAAVSV